MSDDTLKPYSLAILIGRFSPLHLGHIALVINAFKYTEKVLILIGSAGEARTLKCPWTFEERKQMWINALGSDYFDKVIIEPLYDHMIDALWIDTVTTYGKNYGTSDNMTALLGCDKDETSWYIHAFPQWKHIVTSLATNNEGNILHATDIRNAYWNNGDTSNPSIPESVKTFLDYFRGTLEYNNLKKENEFIISHKQQWSVAPYPPTFTTVDSIVTHSDCVLLIIRKGFPHIGSYAIPGGYLDQKERLINGALRELFEETEISVPKEILLTKVKQSKIYDNPTRSLRGRIITHAFHFELDSSTPLPLIKGNDDAEVAEWVPIHKLTEMRSQFFEDHFHILRDILCF